MPHGPVAIARHEGRKDRDGAVQAGDHVTDGDADLERAGAGFAVGGSGDRHQPGLRLDDEVVAGTRGIRGPRTIARDREVNEPRVDARQLRVAETQSLETPR